MTLSATCDTSVLVPALVGWHPDHASASRLVRDEVDALPVHVFLECYSVLTRLPAPHRVSGPDAAAVLQALPMTPLELPGADHRGLVGVLAASGIRGGAVYDGLVGATAAHHGLRLLTRDRRARTTYDVLGVVYALV